MVIRRTVNVIVIVISIVRGRWWTSSSYKSALEKAS